MRNLPWSFSSVNLSDHKLANENLKIKNIPIISINRLTESDLRQQIYLVLRLLTQRLRIDTRTIEPNTVHLKVLKRKRTYMVRKIDPLVKSC